MKWFSRAGSVIPSVEVLRLMRKGAVTGLRPAKPIPRRRIEMRGLRAFGIGLAVTAWGLAGTVALAGERAAGCSPKMLVGSWVFATFPSRLR